MSISEDRLQQDCVIWYRNNYIDLIGTLYSVPNGGKRDPREAKKLVSTGMHKGVADLHLLIDGGITIFLETKTETGTQKPDQVVWEKTVKDLGFTYIIFRSLNEFKQIIYKYVGKERRYGELAR